MLNCQFPVSPRKPAGALPTELRAHGTPGGTRTRDHPIISRSSRHLHHGSHEGNFGIRRWGTFDPAFQHRHANPRKRTEPASRHPREMAPRHASALVRCERSIRSLHHQRFRGNSSDSALFGTMQPNPSPPGTGKAAIDRGKGKNTLASRRSQTLRAAIADRSSAPPSVDREHARAVPSGGPRASDTRIQNDARSRDPGLPSRHEPGVIRSSRAEDNKKPSGACGSGGSV